jgi:hypothetical protein
MNASTKAKTDRLFICLLWNICGAGFQPACLREQVGNLLHKFSSFLGEFSEVMNESFFLVQLNVFRAARIGRRQMYIPRRGRYSRFSPTLLIMLVAEKNQPREIFAPKPDIHRMRNVVVRVRRNQTYRLNAG